MITQVGNFIRNDEEKICMKNRPHAKRMKDLMKYYKNLGPTTFCIKQASKNKLMEMIYNNYKRGH